MSIYAFLYLPSQFQFRITSQYRLHYVLLYSARSRRPSLRLIADLVSASHLHRYQRYHRRTTPEKIDQSLDLDLNLNILPTYVCSPCQAIHQRQEPAALNIPTNDLASLYSELQALKAETINRMAAVGIAPAKRSSWFARSKTPGVVPVPATDFDLLGRYVCPASCNAKRQTTVNINTSVRTNINMNVPPEQLQSVLDANKRALKQVEALLRSLGLPIPEGSFPIITIPQPAPPAQPAPIEPAPVEPAPPSPAPEVPQEPPAPAPEPAPTAPPEAPSPSNTIRTTSTNTRTTTAINGVVTTICVTVGPAPTPTSGPDQGPACPATVTVNSTTTICEGEMAEATGAPA